MEVMTWQVNSNYENNCFVPIYILSQESIVKKLELTDLPF